MATDRDLVARRTQRSDLALPLRFKVFETDVAQVRFTSMVDLKDGQVRGDLVDLSQGGLGILTTVFVPRKAAMTVELLGNAEDGAPVLLECRVRIQTVVMTDRRPAYMLGTSFWPVDESQKAAIEAFVAQVEGGGLV
ncbi:MAG: PilZ domain-containing protein [Planctomycetota bacterium]